ncbi:MAG: ATPase domain-containing protein [Candidatus Micrarchaeota archaeon]
MERTFIKSGVEDFDEILGGGLLKGSVITLSGSTGSGKSTFGMQFLVEGAKNKESGLYISIEEGRQAVFDHLRSYSWDIAKFEKNKQIVFLDYPFHEVDQLLNNSGAIQELINSFGIKRVVIDSILPLALHFQTDDERKKNFIKFIDGLRKWGVTVLLISEDVPATTLDVLPDTKYGVETFSDGWIHIYYLYSPKEKQRTRAIEVLKMKGVAHSTKIYPCEISDNGFVLV